MQRPASIRVALTAFGLACAACTNDAPPPQAMLPVDPVAGAPSAGAPAAGGGGSAGMTQIHMQPDAMVQGIPDAGPKPPDATVHVMDDDDAGPDWVPPDPVCEGKGDWRLAPGFLLARKVDYVADRLTKIVEETGLPAPKATILSEAGVPCASASEKAACRAALDLMTTDLGRHLITTAGDSVRLWNPGVAGNLLGLIDTKSEAVWWAISRGGYLLPCTAKVEKAMGGFNLLGAVSSACGPVPDPSTHRPLNLYVSERGDLLETGLQDPNGFLCGSPADAGTSDGGPFVAGSPAIDPAPPNGGGAAGNFGQL
ncbi:MAG TPA: hypothetical protein VJV78_15265 [Polyangiales bacterium]|nr:hypothetical protein [Polyangiales bacterium]